MGSEAAVGLFRLWGLLSAVGPLWALEVLLDPRQRLPSCGICGLGFMVYGLGFRVWGLGFGVWGLGFRV